MITHAIRNAIEDTVADHIKGQSEFTCFDITREVRLMDFKLLHADCREIVHQIYLDQRMPNYTREMRTVGLNGEEAWVYRPATSAPVTGGFPSIGGTTNLAPGGVMNCAPSSLRTYSIPTTPTPPYGSRGIVRSKADPLIKFQDKRGRLLVPKHLTKAIDLKPGDQAFVYQIGSNLQIAKYKLAWQFVAKYLVDHHGGIYISQKILNRTQFGLCKKQIKITTDTCQGHYTLALMEA